MVNLAMVINAVLLIRFLRSEMVDTNLVFDIMWPLMFISLYNITYTFQNSPDTHCLSEFCRKLMFFILIFKTVDGSTYVQAVSIKTPIVYARKEHQTALFHVCYRSSVVLIQSCTWAW